jgi:hypothetical protein
VHNKSFNYQRNLKRSYYTYHSVITVIWRIIAYIVGSSHFALM